MEETRHNEQQNLKTRFNVWEVEIVSRVFLIQTQSVTNKTAPQTGCAIGACSYEYGEVRTTTSGVGT